MPELLGIRQIHTRVHRGRHGVRLRQLRRPVLPRENGERGVGHRMVRLEGRPPPVWAAPGREDGMSCRVKYRLLNADDSF